MEAVHLTVREVVAADTETFLRLRMALMAELNPGMDAALLSDLEAANRHYLDAKLGRPEEFRAWLVDVAGEVVAIGALIFFERPPTPKCLTGREGYIANVYTLPDWRGRGIATTLTRAILDTARATGLPRVWLRASPVGRPVYERLGFVSNPVYMELVF